MNTNIKKWGLSAFLVAALVGTLIFFVSKERNNDLSRAFLAYDRGDYALALKEIEPFALKEDSEAQFFLGILMLNVEEDGWYSVDYEFKNNDPIKDNIKALEWLNRSAQNGNPKASYALGFIAQKGLINEPNINEAITYYEKAAKENFIPALNLLGSLYLGAGEDEGIELEVNAEKGLAFLKQSYELGDTTAELMLGAIYYTGDVIEKDVKKGIVYLLSAAEKGQVFSYMFLKDAYEKGEGVEKDLQKAESYNQLIIANFDVFLVDPIKPRLITIYGGYPELEKATYERLVKLAEGAEPVAQYRLAQHYAKGIGVSESEVKAKEYYLKAAENGHGLAMYEYAALMEGTDAADEKVKWLEKASELNIVKAYRALAVLYDSWGDMGDEELAYEYYLKAAELGDNESQLKMAEAYDRGYGIFEADSEEAFKWYLILAKKGESSSYYHVALAYEEGRGVEQNLAEAVAYYKKGIVADNDDVNSMYQLAMIYEEGRGGVSKDIDQALKLYQKIIDGSRVMPAANSQYRLARLYEKGEEITQDYAKAIVLYETLLEDYDDKNVLYHLANLYQNGLGTDKNLEKSRELYERSAEQGNQDAQLFLAEILGDSESIDDQNRAIIIYAELAKDENKSATHQLFEKAKKGNALAQYSIAKMLRSKAKSQADYQEFYSWYLKAAEQNMAAAQKELGDFHSYGNSEYRWIATEDPLLAVEWYQKAASNGSFEAHDDLGDLYKEGEKIPQNIEKALEHYKIAAKADISFAASRVKEIEEFLEEFNELKRLAKTGDTEAQYNLAKTYYRSSLLSSQEGEADKWYKKAADNGHGEAAYQLADRLDKNRDEMSEKDLATMALYYEKAANTDHERALRKIGELYLKGIGVKADRKKAKEWLVRAAANDDIAEYDLNEFNEFERLLRVAEKGNPLGQYNIGGYYDRGMGVKPDPIKACEWYKKSAEQGNAKGERAWGTCYEQGVLVKKDLNNALMWYEKALKNGDKAAQEAFDLLSAEVNAEKGDPQAQYSFSLKYYKKATESSSSAYPKEALRAEKWLLKAANGGNANAQVLLGNWYLTDKHKYFERKTATEKGLTLLIQAAAQDSVEAFLALGNWYEKSVDNTEQNALKWYLKAAENKSVTAYKLLANLYTKGLRTIQPNKEEALKWFLLLGKADASQNHFLADIYYKGRGAFEQDTKAAIKYYSLAYDATEKRYIKENIAEIMVNIYAKGLGNVSQDINNAIIWTKNIVDQQIQDNYSHQYVNPLGDSYYQLGTLYERRDNAPDNAYEWYLKALELENSEATKRLIALYWDKKSSFYNPFDAYVLLQLKIADYNYSEKEPSLNQIRKRLSEDEIKSVDAKIAEWKNRFQLAKHKSEIDKLKKQVEAGYSRSMIQLGAIYLEGEKVVKNIEAGTQYYEMAGEKGDLDAYNYLGNHYRKGDGVDQNMEKAIHYFKIAADQGDSNCAHQLGDIYYFGENKTPKNYKEAAKYFEIANPDFGVHHIAAKYKLAHIFYNGQIDGTADKQKAYRILKEVEGFDDEEIAKALATWDFSE